MCCVYMYVFLKFIFQKLFCTLSYKLNYMRFSLPKKEQKYPPKFIHSLVVHILHYL